MDARERSGAGEQEPGSRAGKDASLHNTPYRAHVNTDTTPAQPRQTAIPPPYDDPGEVAALLGGMLAFVARWEAGQAMQAAKATGRARRAGTLPPRKKRSWV